MDRQPLEERLRAMALPDPPEEARAELLRRAETLLPAGRRGLPAWRLAGALALGLLAVNLWFGSVHERRLEALLGPAPAVTCSAECLREARAEQARLLGELSEGDREEVTRPHVPGPVSHLPQGSARCA